MPININSGMDESLTYCSKVYAHGYVTGHPYFDPSRQYPLYCHKIINHEGECGVEHVHTPGEMVYLSYPAQYDCATCGERYWDKLGVARSGGGTKFYRAMLDLSEVLVGLQILCANCHAIKHCKYMERL